MRFQLFPAAEGSLLGVQEVCLALGAEAAVEVVQETSQEINQSPSAGTMPNGVNRRRSAFNHVNFSLQDSHLDLKETVRPARVSERPSRHSYLQCS